MSPSPAGAEAPLAPLTFGAFALISVLSTRNDDPAAASRPFDVDRDGFVMGEARRDPRPRGAIEAALRRGATRHRRGAAASAPSNDAYHMTAPRPDGRDAARAITVALADAALQAERIGYVNAHGSSTPLNEPAEARAILRAPRARTARSYRSPGTKGLYGHALGASGAVEAAITALAIERGTPAGHLQPARASIPRSRWTSSPRPARTRRRRADELVRVRRDERRPGAGARLGLALAARSAQASARSKRLRHLGLVDHDRHARRRAPWPAAATSADPVQ